MKCFNVDLKKEYGTQGGVLECLIGANVWDGKVPDWKRPALIVVPGGGYGMVSRREAEPVAFAFMAKGFQTFILDYAVAGENGYSYPEQLIELGASVDYVKKHAEEFLVNPDEVFVVGFSAGGHLTANLAVEYASVPEKAGKPLACKPTAVGLSYPVISKIHGHQGSYEYLLYGYSEEAQEELLKTLNLDQAVNEQTPPAFIWATAKDMAVPPDNALRYAMSLDKFGIDYELHIYPRGQHGTSVGNLEVNVLNENQSEDNLRQISRWVEDCANFFRQYCVEVF